MSTPSESLRAAPPELADPHSGERAWWTYCVLWAREAARVPPQLEGVEPGTTLDLVSEGELAALISGVPAEDYDDVHLRVHLEDLAWVERTARRHEAVLEEMLGHVTIVPLRLCTLCRERSGVRRLLRDHADQLRASLAKVEGSAEWGVKVFSGRGEGGESASEADSGRPEGGPGATYLLERQHQRERAERAAARRATCAEAIHERISAYATESASNPPQRPELHGRDMTMLLNSAYLVPADRTAELQDAVGALQAEWASDGFLIELTGPWPAYNFVTRAGE